MCNVCRTPVKVKREPITYITEDLGYKKVGGWFAFSKPVQGEPLPKRKLKKNERVLWCPWCGDWNIFKKDAEDTRKWKCLGYCGWANTNEWNVRHSNSLWNE